MKSLQGRLLSRFGIVLLSVVALAVTVTVYERRVEERVADVHYQGLEAVIAVDEIELDVVQVQQWLTDVSATRAAPGYDDGFDMAALYAAEFTIDVERLRELRPDASDQLDLVAQDFEAFYAGGIEMANAYVAGGPDAGNAQMEIFDTAAEAMAASLDELRSGVISDAGVLVAEAESALSQLAVIVTVLSVVVVAGIVAIALLSARSIARPIVDMARAADRAAIGDVDFQIAHRGSDEVGQLADSFRKLAAYLQSHASVATSIADGHLVIEEVRHSDHDALGLATEKMVATLRSLVATSTETVTGLHSDAAILDAAATEMATASAAVADAISSVAQSSSEEVAAFDWALQAVQVIQEEVRRTVDATGRSAQAAEATLERAQLGSDKALAVTEAMDHIVTAIDSATSEVASLGDRSNEVAEAVELIGAIADQTNLLALNAAIEAARAGEAGQGFSVVATEVKSLAEQAASSADSIARIVSGMSDAVVRAIDATARGRDQVLDGSDQVQELGQEFAGILGSVDGVVGDVRSARSAAARIDDAATTIGERVAGLRDVAEEIGASSETVAASSEESAATAAEVQRVASSVLRAGELLTESFSHLRV